jgi:Uma2 family endonuclease
MLDLNLIAPEVPRRITRAEYDKIVAMGVLGDDRVELLQGVIVSMSPNDPPHASPVELLTEILVVALVGRARVRIQLPIVASDESEPEPDIAVVPTGDYSRSHPDKAYLIIEVADSSLRKDRLVKGPLYAASHVQEYWVVNVRDRIVEVHRTASGNEWASITQHGLDATLHLEAFPDVGISVAAVLR